ncbi:MAG TPA: septal ring lytic transglycosylase RlpA family protein [Myxococcales bacterium]|jgi:rare lipoprotein A|nr:septal ring lytic transglycosylase RlpA family protein [Myxococcales bacterium]
MVSLRPRRNLALIWLLVLSAACAHAPQRTVREPSLEPPAQVAAHSEPSIEEPVKRPKPIAEGLASWYGDAFRGRLTASGTRFDPSALTAAHRSLPFGTCLRVENLDNGRQVDVRVTDRGPYVNGRILDLSEAAARRIDLVRQGVGQVRLFRCGG